jgi:phosphoadenosine phosphosulfate reductase
MTGTAVTTAWQAAIDERTDPERFVAWTLERFGHLRIVLTTQFGMEGCALIDMYASHGVPLTVVYLDTMFLFPETYALRDRLVARYPHLSFENRGTIVTPEQQATLHGEGLWTRAPDLCCRIRKVDPMREALAGVDVWITGITRGQSQARARIPLIGWDWQFQLLKISPLAAWDRKQVWEYVQRQDVPYNPLHELGYPTIGCTHCTKPVPGASVTEYTRLGRWDNTGKTECGLHINGSGI